MMRIPMSRFPFRFHIATLLTAFLLASGLIARGGEVDMHGFWELREPAGDTCVLIIKRGGQASCFWSGSSSTRIEKGNWAMDGERLVITWQSGHRDVVTSLGQSSIQRASYGPDMPLDGPPSYEVRGVRVDSRLPGSLTVQRSPADPRAGEPAAPGAAAQQPPVAAATPAQDEAGPLRNPFTGFWRGANSSGFMGIGGAKYDHFFIHLDRGGRARCALRNWGGKEGMIGTWELRGDTAAVTWPDGHRDELRRAADGSYELLTYTPSRNPDRGPSSRIAIRRASADEAKGLFDAGTLNLLTTTDIRGLWTPREPGAVHESIAIEGWGNAYRSPSRTGSEGSDAGEWRLTGDRVIISWIDGSKDVIRAVARGFVQESFAPGVPITGEPERVIQVVKTP